MRRIVLSFSLLGLTACADGLAPARERTGFISAVTYANGPDLYSVQYFGAFYLHNGLSADPGQLDNCQGLPLAPAGTPVASPPTLDAGAYLLAQLSGREDTLTIGVSTGPTLYGIPGVSNTVAFIPGDTLTVVIPGNAGGFPAMTVRVRTAEPFTFDAIGNSLVGEPLAINWTPAPAPGSVIVFRLRFSNNPSVLTPNVQIRCVFVDDGVGQVPAVLADVWSSSDPASRVVTVERIRQTTTVFDAMTKVILLSFFDRPLLAAP